MILSSYRNADRLGIVEALQSRRAEILASQSEAVRRRVMGARPGQPIAASAGREDLKHPAPTKAPPWQSVVDAQKAAVIFPWPWLPTTEDFPRRIPSSDRKRLAEAICDIYEVNPAQFFGATRIARVARPRQAAMWLAWNWLGMSITEIGRWLGDRDHTTALHGIHKHEERMLGPIDARERDYVARFDLVKAKLADMEPPPPKE